MKLKDLLNEEMTKAINDLSTSKKTLQKEPNSLQWSRIGRPGQQAVAYTVDRKPDKNQVVKVVDMVNTADPAYQFLRLCKSHQNNPHFPQIYNVKQYPAKNGGYHMIINMERLYHISHTDENILYELFGIENNGTLDIHITNLDLMFDEPETRKLIIELTKFKSLKQAMRLLEPLFKNYMPDMHSGNIMYRKTPNGPVLVFLDPIQYDNTNTFDINDLK